MGLLKQLYDFGEEALARLAQELLSSPCVADALAAALQRGFAAKGRMDKNIQMLLGLLNLPSRADLARIVTKLEILQGSLVNLNLKVDRLLATRPPPRPRKTPAPPAGGAPGT
mgnify:FL=1